MMLQTPILCSHDDAQSELYNIINESVGFRCFMRGAGNLTRKLIKEL